MQLKRIVKEKKGSTYIETVITVLIAVMVTIVGINVFLCCSPTTK